jgi:DNA (cytosine-5)-methyltransferase 1
MESEEISEHGSCGTVHRTPVYLPFHMIYGSVCSGIEAATAAWHPLGWTPAFFSEIEPFPSEILKTHYPDTPNYGDLTKHTTWPVQSGAIDVLVGGTPCQSFSIAGLRKGLEDPRGNLCLTFLGLVDRLKPKYVVWENVPGVLSSNGGRDFGSFVGALGQIGYGWAYRVLDAQFFGVAQRRRRVFVVGCLGDWRRAAEILFESACLQGDPTPSRKAKKVFARTFEDGFRVSGGLTGDPVPARMVAFGEYVEDDTASTIKQRDYKDATDLVAQILPTAFDAYNQTLSYTSQTIGSAASDINHVGGVIVDAPVPLQASKAVRRLTPLECERLQGFRDNYTLIPWKNKSACPDGPRYKALGNSMAVPCMAWIGKRIQKQFENQPAGNPVKCATITSAISTRSTPTTAPVRALNGGMKEA